MADVNKKRVALGVVVGGVVWGIWSAVVNAVILSPHYIAAYEKGELIKGGRYPLFLVYWFIGLFLFTRNLIPDVILTATGREALILEADGLVSPASGSKPREVLVDKGYFDEVDSQLR